MANYEGHLIHLFSDFVQIGFFNAQNAENAFEWPFDILKNRFMDITEVVFRDVQKHMISPDNLPN
jgi:hypothetical protein